MEGTTHSEADQVVLTANGNDPLDEALAEEGKDEPGVYSVEDMFGDDEDNDAGSPDTPSDQVGGCCGGRLS